MKTQIIQLAEYDDTLSVRDRMDWSQTPRVLLVWPGKGKVLRNRLDLILLQRHCSSHGSQLALSTKDPEVVFQARAAGIPVFPTRQEAQLQPWGKSFREFQRQDLLRYKSENPPPENLSRDKPQPRKALPLWARISLFTLGVLSVLAIAATLLPSAEITLVPQGRQRRLTVPFQAQTGGTEIGISGIVPGRSLTLTVSGQLSAPATGKLPIPSESARGKVLFTNLGGESITIPKGTILSTGGDDPVLFQTLETKQTPEGSGASVEMPVEALYPGEAGNIGPGQIGQINWEEGADLTVTNPEPISGGTDMLIPAPSEFDRFEISLSLDRILEQKAQQQAAAALQPGDVLLSSNWDDSQIQQESYTPPEDAPGDTLWLDRTSQFEVVYASHQDLEALAKELVAAQYQDSDFRPQLDSITIQNLTAPVQQEKANFTWQVQIQWQEIQDIDPQEVISWIQGQNRDEAEGLLQDRLQLDGTPEIDIRPRLWPRLPILPFRIQIEQGGEIHG